MPRQLWSKKREHQYEHIRDGLEARGRSAALSEEIAARTVNKERARHGEARSSQRSSTQDISSARRGGLRSHGGPAGRTKQQLYEEARSKGIRGRSSMTKSQLQRAVDAR
jgi:plasmid stabilization system protein ParE